MLKMFKELAREAEHTYKCMTEATIKTIIRENLPYDVDEAIISYYAVVYSAETCDSMDDETYNYIESCQIKEEKLLRIALEKCGNAIYNAIVELDEWCRVSWALCYDGSISYTIRVDGMEFEIMLENRFNNQ